MRADDALLVFLDPSETVAGWLLLRDQAVAARGTGLESLPSAPSSDTDPRMLVAAVPGDAISIHWLEIPAGLSTAQALAAARLAAGELCAQPLEDMHVALGAEREGAARPVALVPSLVMAQWLGLLRAAGLDPDAMVPEPMLLSAPETGFLRHDIAGRSLFRGADDAFSLEPDLAAAILGTASVQTIDTAQFEAGLADAAARPVLDLRQGVFAKARPRTLDRATLRRLLLLAAAILVATVAIKIATAVAYARGTDALEVEAERVAAAALPGPPTADPVRSLARRAAEAGGGRAGWQPLAIALFAAVRDVPEAQLTALRYDPDGSLHATVQGGAAAGTALRERIEAAGLAATASAQGGGLGAASQQVTVRAR